MNGEDTPECGYTQPLPFMNLQASPSLALLAQLGLDIYIAVFNPRHLTLTLTLSTYMAS